jgi:hypothetical protein
MTTVINIFFVSACLFCCAFANADAFSDHSVGVGILVGRKADNKVEYDISGSLIGTLPVGGKITIQFQPHSITNKDYVLPDKALLILEPTIIEPFTTSGTNITNGCLVSEYQALGGDIYRSVLPYTGHTQISNVFSNISNYIASPTNSWLASQEAVTIAISHVKNNPPADVYSSETHYVLHRPPYRYNFGWVVTLEVENGFFGGLFCRVVVGDDKHVKNVLLF